MSAERERRQNTPAERARLCDDVQELRGEVRRLAEQQAGTQRDLAQGDERMERIEQTVTGLAGRVETLDDYVRTQVAEPLRPVTEVVADVGALLRLGRRIAKGLAWLLGIVGGAAGLLEAFRALGLA